MLTGEEKDEDFLMKHKQPEITEWKNVG